jgi:hypothetical protein
MNAAPWDSDSGTHGATNTAGRRYLKLGTWQWGLCEEVDDQVIADVLASLRAATEYGRGWGKAWHHWALFNAAAMEHYAKNSPGQAIRHVAPAVSGFFRSIALEGSTKRRGGCLQARPSRRNPPRAQLSDCLSLSLRTSWHAL